MGFKYLFVPADTHEPLQELEYGSDIKTLEEDTFRAHVEKYYAQLGQSADKSVLLKQLSDRTGVNLEEKTGKGEMPQEALDRLLGSTSVEIFPVQLPTKDCEFQGVSVYCDDKGVAKDLPENSRVSGIVQACGYPGQTFRGDCFIGRVFDDNEDEWRRIDFTMKDCSSDAEWVAATKKQRSNRSSSDMSSMASKIGANSPMHINPSMLPDSTPQGETEQYKWRQTDDEVEITFKKTGIQKSDKKEVKVAFSRAKIKVEVKGETLLQGDLQSLCTPDDCTWTLGDGELQVTLAKAEGGTWKSLLKN
jgi:HSP20 family molecular chaperone IbpA|mmetsp:Transcript_87894/g.138742  ORF Transcript_87894/g.138742 Transcript_87894/m.138742 type:complete len:305 (+) Transcript_87894:63-977(+)|eukprot:CAMPEP_0169183630 /NCGR_PEP_ID=MMETSP1016-20121227/766_1 /TAXON_ID=342587 /ORGANISM="Karlodinium micrum, Strain CCMP2283" /LENGTH=304 /DNA_ID=CAMNT_0009259081 /DNA_START=62 /DNA_END=976 /DNA_ORIENTATION=+